MGAAGAFPRTCSWQWHGPVPYGKAVELNCACGFRSSPHLACLTAAVVLALVVMVQ